MRYERALEEHEEPTEEDIYSESESFDDETKRPADLPEDSIDNIDLDLNLAISASPTKSTKRLSSIEVVLLNHPAIGP